jgi:archaellum component FlaC
MIDEKRTQHVALGCGTLILIALIVMLFGGGPSMSNLENEVRGLRSEVGNLKAAVELQTNEIRQLREKVEKAQKAK